MSQLETKINYKSPIFGFAYGFIMMLLYVLLWTLLTGSSATDIPPANPLLKALVGGVIAVPIWWAAWKVVEDE